MEQYISTITLDINGQQMDDFNSFTEKERVFKKAVGLMNTTGILKTRERHFFDLDYVIPANKPEFDFVAVEDGTVTVDYENGKRVSFGEVHCLAIGEAKADGDKEMTKTISFVAGTRTEE